MIACKEFTDRTTMIPPSNEFEWDARAYELENDPNPETWADILTDALGPRADSYLALMRWDVDRVVEALSSGQ